MGRIEKLTEEQEVLLQDTLNKWLTIGRSCEPLNMDKVNLIVEDFYRRIGKEKPLILKFDSPYSCMIAIAMLKSANIKGNLLNDQLESQLNDQLWDQLRSRLWAQLRAQLESQLWGQLYDQLRGQLWGQLGSQLYDQLNWSYFGGSLWCNLEVFYKYCHDIGVTYTSDQLELLDLWLRQSEEMSLWWPMEGICVVSERPEFLNTDDAGRLHNPDGPAIRYRDGWSVYAINGVRMPEKYFTEPVTVDVIDQEENAEISRKLIERYGLQKYIEDSNAEKIAEDEWGILYRKDVLNDEPIVMVSVLNSTPEEYEYEGLEERLEKREFRRSELGTPGKYKRYMLRVPPDTKTPLQGLAWMADMTEEEYAMLDCES